MKRKQAAIGLVVLFLGASTAHADKLSDNFAANLNQSALDALAKDLGAVMGGGSFHSGKALGFPLGFDLGVHVPVVGVRNEDTILRDNTSVVGAAWGQLEVGLPAKINVIGRYGKLLDANLIGGGLKLGLFTSSVPGIPSVSISGLYDKLDHDFIDLHTISANIALSFDVPFIHPYIGAGWDKTTLKPTSQAFASAPAGVPRSLEGSASGYRAEVGVNLSVIPFTYITLGGGVANGQRMFHGGLGVQF